METWDTLFLIQVRVCNVDEAVTIAITFQKFVALKKVLFFLLFLLPLASSAQREWYLSGQVGVSYGSLQNRNDRKSDKLSIDLKGRPKYGLEFGFFAGSKSGFRGLSLSIQSVSAIQTTSGSNLNIRFPVSGNTYSKLNYLMFPLEAKLGIGRFGKFEPLFRVGIYGGYLLKYHELLHREYAVKGLYYQELTTEGKVMTEDARDSYGGGGVTVIGLKDGLYKNFDFGVTGSITGNYEVSDHFFLSLMVGVSRGFVDIERKEKLEFTTTAPPYNRFTEDSYWIYETPKGITDKTSLKERGGTYLLMPSIQFTIGYRSVIYTVSGG